jgi:hypothetical protein
MSDKIITGKVRFSYVNVFKPSIGVGTKEKYSISLIVPKTDKDTVYSLRKGIDSAIKQGISTVWNGKKPAQLRTPLRDGDEARADDPAYADSYFFNASASVDNKPPVYDSLANLIRDESEIYSGCFGRASVAFIPYNMNGNCGVTARLLALMKLCDGPRLGALVGSANDFKDGYVDTYSNEDKLDF